MPRLNASALNSHIGNSQMGNTPAAPVVFCLDDNLVLATETLGRLWTPRPETWPVNDNNTLRRLIAQKR